MSSPNTLCVQVLVGPEAAVKRIASSRLFGLVARDAPDDRIRPGPIRTVSGIRPVAAGFRYASFAVLRLLLKRLAEIKIRLW